MKLNALDYLGISNQFSEEELMVQNTARDFSENEFNDKKFYRLRYIKWLIENHKLDSNLFMI